MANKKFIIKKMGPSIPGSKNIRLAYRASKYDPTVDFKAWDLNELELKILHGVIRKFIKENKS